MLCESSDDTSLTADIKMKILDYLQAKYSDSITCELLNITSYLDPRFMVSYIHKDDVEDTKKRLVEEGEQIMKDNTSDQQEVQLSTKPQQRDATLEPTAKRRKLGSWLKKASTSTSTSQESSKRIKEEMDSYE